MSKRYLAFSLVTMFVLIVSACAPNAPATSATSAPTQPPAVATQPPVPTDTAPPPEPKILRLSGGASDYGTIDPSLATQSAEIQIAETTSLGVVRQNETTAEIELSMATGYDLSADGLTYTIKLMPGVPWVHYNADSGQVEVVKDCQGKDRTVTAQDFAYGIVRTIDPATASDYAYALIALSGWGCGVQ